MYSSCEKCIALLVRLAVNTTFQPCFEVVNFHGLDKPFESYGSVRGIDSTLSVLHQNNEVDNPVVDSNL